MKASNLVISQDFPLSRVLPAAAIDELNAFSSAVSCR